MKKKTILLLILLIILGILIYFIFQKNSFEENTTQNNTQNNKIPSENLENRTETDKNNLIQINNPTPNQSIKSPILIEGKAKGFWFFEASFPVKLFDDNGFLLGKTTASALSDWMTEDFVDFKVNLNFSVPSTVKGKLILEKDNPSGLPENSDKLIIPVYFNEIQNNQSSTESTTIKIFLSDEKYINKEPFDCSKTKAVLRQIPKTPAIARAAIEALLRGATEEEINQGLFSSINPGTRIKSLTIDNNGTAKIDFDEQLEFQVGGSCRVTAIRAQITDTLKQFQTINNVIISINGRNEDILQP